MPEPKSDEAQERPDSYNKNDMQPVPVSIHEDKTPAKIRAATYSGWSSYRFAGTEKVPVKILPYDERRRRAVVQGLPGFTSNNTQGNMWIGSEAQINSGNPTVGAVLVSGQSVTVESASALWCIPDGTHELTVTVLDEIYRT